MTGYDKALNAYQNAQDQHMNGAEIYAELLKGIIKNLYLARDAHKENDLEKLVELNAKTVKIITALRSSLDFEENKDASEWLSDFYIELMARVGRVLRAEDTEKEYDEIVELVKPVYQRWADFAAQAQ